MSYEVRSINFASTKVVVWETNETCSKSLLWLSVRRLWLWSRLRVLHVHVPTHSSHKPTNVVDTLNVDILCHIFLLYEIEFTRAWVKKQWTNIACQCVLHWFLFCFEICFFLFVYEVNMFYHAHNPPLQISWWSRLSNDSKSGP